MATFAYTFSSFASIAGGNNAWSIPGLASVASVAVHDYDSGASNILRGSTPVVSGPAPASGGIVLGIQVDLSVKSSANYLIDQVAQLRKSGSALTNKATSTRLPSAYTTVTYGGPTELWGTTWTVSDLSGISFDYMVVAEGGGIVTNGNGFVNSVTVTVYIATSVEEENIMQGTRYIDDVVTITAQFSNASTGAATDATGSPAYRVYEDQTLLFTGTMATLDGSNTDGFYSAQFTASAANGFEVNKTYTVWVSATVATIAQAKIIDRFVIRSTVADSVWGATRTQATNLTPTTYGPMLDLVMKGQFNRFVKDGNTVTLYNDANTSMGTQTFSVTSTGFDRAKGS